MHRKLMITNFTIICRKAQDKETLVSLIGAPTMQVMMKILNLRQQMTTTTKKKFHVLQENLCLS